MPEAGFLISDDFESYSSTADVVTAYGAGNVGGAFSAAGGRTPSKAMAGSIKSTAIAGVSQDVAYGMAYLGGSASRLQIWGEKAGFPAIKILYLDVGTTADGHLYWSVGSGTNRLPIGPRAENVWRYLEVQYLADLTLGHIHIALDGDRLFDIYGATAPTVNTSYVIYNGVFDDIYARVPRSPDYLGNVVDYLNVGPNAVDFVGDYRLRHNLAGDLTTTGNARVTQQMVNTAYHAIPANVRVTQQMVDVAYVPPKPMARVTQQYVIVAIKNKPGARVRPQVVGIGRP